MVGFGLQFFAEATSSAALAAGAPTANAAVATAAAKRVR